MKEKKHERYFITFLLFWLMGITILRGIRLPNDWAEAHWLINYQFGFLKRSLPGTILLPLFKIWTGKEEQIIQITAALLLSLFFGLLLWAAYRIIAKTKADLESIFILGIFFTSPFIVMSAHLNGYYDNLLISITIFAILLLLNEKKLAAATLITAGFFVHENILLLGYPSLLLTALLKHDSETSVTRDLSRPAHKSDMNVALQSLRSFILEYKSLIIIPAIAFAFIFLHNSLILDAKPLREELTTHLATFDFIKKARNYLVAESFTNSFFYYLKTERLDFFKRLTSATYLKQIGIPLLLYLLYLWRKLDKKWLFLPVAGTILLPLSFHIIAWDTSRIWTYPIVAALLTVWILSETMPSETQKSASIYIILAFLAILYQTQISTPLYDSLKEEFTTAQRINYYAPPLLLLLIYTITRYLPTRKKENL